MSGSWHNFLFGSLDAHGLMTVDKPPMALWVQALSVKAFGFNSWAILVPQALMGAAGVGLLYDLTRRHWGRQAGFVAGLVLALTPIAVAVSRHKETSVSAAWLEAAISSGRIRWILSGGGMGAVPGGGDSRQRSGDRSGHRDLHRSPRLRTRIERRHPLRLRLIHRFDFVALIGAQESKALSSAAVSAVE